MMTISWKEKLCEELQGRSRAKIARRVSAVLLMLATGVAMAQDNTAKDTSAAPGQDVQYGYVVHQSADLGGHMAGVTGSGAMYDTLVNLHSGPRVLGQTFALHALPGTKHVLFDSLTAFSNGFGGDPINFAKMDVSKGKLYEFNGTFRRDRQYFDYDLLGNPSIPGDRTIPIGPAATPTGFLKWPQVNESPFLYNTVRRMTDVNLTLLPLNKITFRIGYSQNVFEGPTIFNMRSIGKNDALLADFVRTSTDDFTGAVDFKPFQQTKLTLMEVVDHIKDDTNMTLAPQGFIAQEADGTPVVLGSWDLVTPYGTSACNATSMANGNFGATTILLPSPTAGGLPIINPACSVATSWVRSAPVRILLPTEIVELQSSSIKNLALNGDFRYTRGNMNLSNYFEQFKGLNGAIRQATFTGPSTAERQVVSTDFGVTWQFAPAWSLSDQVSYSDTHIPGTASTSAGITITVPTTAGNETINNTTYGAGTTTITGNANGTPLNNYFGQMFLTNNASVTWDASDRSTFTLTYRHQQHQIVQNAATGTTALVVTINEDGGILGIALRPTTKWNINGSVEVSYSDNVLTPIAPRQLQHYRVHTIYRPKAWATVSAAYNDLERSNNTNNTGAVSAAGPIGHFDHTRLLGLTADLAPTEKWSAEMSYAFSEVFTTTNICYLSGAAANLPGTATVNSAGAPAICPGSTTTWGPAKDFMEAPTQYGSVGITYVPNKRIRSGLGYRISSVSGNQFFNDAQAVNGSLQSAYQTPYVHSALAVKPSWIWKAEYDFYGYGEGGPSGSPLCSTSTSATAVIVPCNSTTLTEPTGLTEPSSGLSAPRNFHANLVTISMHYEF